MLDVARKRGPRARGDPARGAAAPEHGGGHAECESAEGTGAAWYKRDPQTVRRMLVGTLRSHAALLAQWNSLSAGYREAAGRITSFAAWEETFAANPAPTRPEASGTAGPDGPTRSPGGTAA